MNEKQPEPRHGAASSESRGPGTRRPYARPTLTEYGSIAKLTQGTRTNQADGGGGGGFKMTCL